MKTLSSNTPPHLHLNWTLRFQMGPYSDLLLVLLICCCAILKRSFAATADHYTAAVYEHARFGVISDPAEEIIQKNIGMYRKAAKIAKSKGADIILFPEYGIFPPGEKRQVKPFMEKIPDPRRISSNPCEEFDENGHSYILRSLSCMARWNSIYLVANMGDSQDCKGGTDCPSDGVLYYNTNVVFDRNGTLILKYYKEHLFVEEAMTLPKEQQEPIFDTEFGRFATFICFDIVFYRMTQVAQMTSVDAVLFSARWMDNPPLFTSVPYFQAWALGNNATLLASNVQLPHYFTIGSGIFHAQEGALGYSFNPDGQSKLIIAKVPKKNAPLMVDEATIVVLSDNHTFHSRNDGKDVLTECSNQLLKDVNNDRKDYRCFDLEVSNYTFVKLTKPSDHVEACNNGMCCQLDYTARILSENFYLGVFNGSHNALDKYFYCEENCILVRCDMRDGKPCSTFPMKSKTVFHNIQLKAKLTTQHAYPYVVSSGMRLVPKRKWKYGVIKSSSYEAVMNLKTQAGIKIIVAGFHSRCYNKDPPYVR